MRGKSFNTLLFFLLSLVACSKSSSDTDNVYLRVENATGEPFTDFTLNETAFGVIEIGQITQYQRLRNVSPVAFANIITINHNNTYIADIVPTAYLKDGHYVLRILSDTSSFHYAGSIVKE